MTPEEFTTHFFSIPLTKKQKTRQRERVEKEEKEEVEEG